MFAFCFFNKNKSIVVVRDRVGIKPLYYINDTGSFEFSSEIKALQYSIDTNKVKNCVPFGVYQNGYLPYGNVKGTG